MNLTKELRRKIEDADFSVSQVDDTTLEFRKASPSGQDFSFCIDTENDLNLFCDNILERYNDFDTSYETFLWLDNSGHGKYGAPYDMKELYEDMDACREYINELYQIVADYAKIIDNRRKSMKVFLDGENKGYDWRNDLIPLLKCGYYNPIAESVSKEDVLREIHERKTADYILHVITPDTKNILYIAEIIDDSNKKPEKTILCMLCDGIEKRDIRGLEAVVDIAESNGVTVCKSLPAVAEFLNSRFD